MTDLHFWFSRNATLVHAQDVILFLLFRQHYVFFCCSKFLFGDGRERVSRLIIIMGISMAHDP